MAVLAVTIVMLLLSSMFVFLRVVSRVAIVHRFKVDDYFIILAWALALGISFCICYGCTMGLGRRDVEIPGKWRPPLRKTNYAFSVLYQPALMAVKTSILAFYLSLPTINRNFKWANILTLFTVNAGGLALLLFTIFQCNPVGAAFAYPVPAGAQCTDIITIYLSSAPLNIITDLAIFFLPMPILTAMRMPRRQKIILVVTFSFGAFSAIVDVLRVIYLQTAAESRLADVQTTSAANTTESESGTDLGTDLRRNQYRNFNYYASLSFMWTAVEVNVALMCACVPALKPLVARFLPRLLRDLGDTSGTFGKRDSIAHPADSVVETEDAACPPLPEMAEPGVVHRRDFSMSAGLQDSRSDGYGGVVMTGFLTTPDMNGYTPPERTQTARTNTSRNTRPSTPNFFDFVNMKRTKSLVHMTNRESVFPIAVVTVLFFIWGFEYGLLDVLNQQFQRVASMTPAQSTGIHSAYFAGYFFGPVLAGQPLLKYWGFKACFTVGLSIYACGTLIFWPAAVLTSFWAFIVTHFIIAFGLSILEVAANPFITLCGPQEYAEIRLNLSQGVQAIGSVVAPLIANRAFIRSELDAPSLINTQWAYLGIAFFTVCLAVAFYYVPLPGATDQELDDAVERTDNAHKAKLGGVEIIWVSLAFGAFSQFCYVGGQEVVATSFETYLQAVAPSYDVSNHFAIAHTAFAVSRFLAAGLGIWIKPRLLLLFFFIGAILFSALAMFYDGGTGTAMITMLFFAEGPIFALIFAQTLRGMGRYAKPASVVITAAISGGAVFVPISSSISNVAGDARYATIVALAAFACGMAMPIYSNAVAKARRLCDPAKDLTVGDEIRPNSNASRMGAALEIFTGSPTSGPDEKAGEVEQGNGSARR